MMEFPYYHLSIFCHLTKSFRVLRRTYNNVRIVYLFPVYNEKKTVTVDKVIPDT